MGVSDCFVMFPLRFHWFLVLCRSLKNGVRKSRNQWNSKETRKNVKKLVLPAVQFHWSSFGIPLGFLWILDFRRPLTKESANVSFEQKKFFGSKIQGYKQQKLILGFPGFDQLEPYQSWGEVSDGPIRKQ